MTFNEFSNYLADEIKKNPTHSQIVKVANEILKASVDGRPISDAEIHQLLYLLEKELGNLAPVNKQYDNHETLSFIEEINRLIDQAKKE